MKFNEKLMRLRKQQGYSQEILAEKLGVSRQAISRWELGETTPEMALLAKLCQVFQVSADYLIRDDLGEQEHDPASGSAVQEERGPKQSEETEPGQDFSETGHSSGSEETGTVVSKRRAHHLFSAVCYTIAVMGSVIGIGFAQNRIQLALGCGTVPIMMGLAIRQYLRYFKGM